ncbi:cytochrome c oxidase assembly protein [Deinococcus ruber]|uniref:Membrane protein n=1 Tax=Deinococcus ruber TaxID=1848197 RepID=A0A918BVX6_9DEIO|nr:cytochrome c oxidase assembly protein [Deinococcus ruber]GGQ95056.1 membrane protein [Deinococcus ruber]
MTPTTTPTLFDLLAPHPDWLWLLGILAVAGWYTVGAWRASRAGLPWPAWRVACFGAALVLALLVTQTAVTRYTLLSMTLYMVRLMVLAELIPPLAVLGLPPGRLTPRGGWGRALSWVLDPWVALALWATVVIFWNIPASFSASLVSNTAGGLLPLLYLLGGALSWAVVLRPLPGVQGRSMGNRGWFGLLSSLPMMAVAAVWLYSPRVLYAPYVGALCLWNTTPLQNQVSSGWVMMIAGLPGMALALAQLMVWLIGLADSGTVTYEDEPEPDAPTLPPAQEHS